MMEFTFEKSPWEQMLATLHSGDRIFGLECLKRIEDLSQEEAEEALLALEERGIALDVTDLPPCGNDGEAAVRLKLEQELSQNRQLLTGLEENDPLRLYLEELSGIPAAGDEKLLVEQYLAGNDNVAQQLVNLSLGRVVERACAMTGHGVLLLDLIQEGSLGLWQGILNYTGGDYEPHVCWWIDQYLAKAVLMQAHTGGIWQKMRQGMADYRDMDQRLLAELGRNPTLEEIAQAIHISPEEAATYASMLNQARAKEQMEQLRQPQEKTPEDEQAVENTAYFQTRQRIADMLSTLTEQEGKLLTLRFGLEGGMSKTPEDTGAILGLSPEEVIKQEAAALLKLRQQADSGGSILWLKHTQLQLTALPAQAKAPSPSALPRSWVITMWTPVRFTVPWHIFWTCWVSALRMWTVLSVISTS